MKYAYNGPFNEPINFGIPWRSFFQIKAIKFSISMGLNKISNISPWFYHNHDNIFYEFYAFSDFAHWQSPLELSRPQFFSCRFQTWQGHSLSNDLGRVQLCCFWLIIFGTNVWLNTLLDINYNREGFLLRNYSLWLEDQLRVASFFLHNYTKHFCMIFLKYI